MIEYLYSSDELESFLFQDKKGKHRVIRETDPMFKRYERLVEHIRNARFKMGPHKLRQEIRIKYVQPIGFTEMLKNKQEHEM